MSGGEWREVTVRCLLLFGDQAELVPDGADADAEPARWPVTAITADTGLEPGEVPGRRFRVRALERDGEVTFSGFLVIS